MPDRKGLGPAAAGAGLVLWAVLRRGRGSTPAVQTDGGRSRGPSPEPRPGPRSGPSPEPRPEPRPGDGGAHGREGDEGRGRMATSPTEIPAQGWKDVLSRVKASVKGNRVPLVAAGVAFYSMLALVPALVAVVSLYGLVAGPKEVSQQLSTLTKSMPRDVGELLRNMLKSTSSRSSGGLGVGFAVTLAGAVWSASSGMRALINGLNVAYDEPESRKFAKLRGAALLLTVFNLAITLGLLIVLLAAPKTLAHGTAGTAVAIGRWPVLLVAIVVSLAVIYRYGPDRDHPRWAWVSWGAAAATVGWIVASVLLAVYAANVGRFDRTYGSLGGVVVLLLWLYLSALVILLGGEVNAEMEHQTRRDTTAGAEAPLGERGARVADEVGPAAA